MVTPARAAKGMKVMQNRGSTRLGPMPKKPSPLKVVGTSGKPMMNQISTAKRRTVKLSPLAPAAGRIGRVVTVLVAAEVDRADMEDGEDADVDRGGEEIAARAAEEIEAAARPEAFSTKMAQQKCWAIFLLCRLRSRPPSGRSRPERIPMAAANVLFTDSLHPTI